MRQFSFVPVFALLAAPSALAQRVVSFSVFDSAPGVQPPIEASSAPTLGSLYPMSPFLNVAPNGNVGMGTTSPAWPLDVFGEGFGSHFYVLDTAPGNGQLVSWNQAAAFTGAQTRFSGTGSDFIDIGQNSSGAFVVESDDVAILTIGRDGNAAMNGAPFNNVRLTTRSDYNFTTYGANSSGANQFSAGLFGDITDPADTGFGAAVYGRSVSPAKQAVFAEGDSGATGVKSFIQPHPTDASKQIRFVCLEGNESGTYFRGKTQLQGGIAVVPVPEEFRLASEAENLTVQLTAMGNARVWVQSYDLDQVVIGGTADIEVHYMVNGVRRGYGDLETIVPNTAYVPRGRRPFGTQYPQAIRDMLVENGILNPDYTPNELTASRMGWSLEIDPVLADQPVGR